MKTPYEVVENALRDPRTRSIISSSFWVCGPNGYLRGPFTEEEAMVEAQRLNQSLAASEAAGSTPRPVEDTGDRPAKGASTTGSDAE